MANTECDKEQSSEVLGGKKKGKTVTTAEENEEKPSESKNTEQRKYSQHRSSICNQLDERSHSSPF